MSAAAHPEYQVKAAILVKLLGYVTFPDVAMEGRTEIVIGIIGKNPFGSHFDPMTGKTTMGRRLVIRDLGPADGVAKPAIAQAARSCHLLFVATEDKNEVERLLGALQGAPVLTVGEDRSFVGTGGMVRLFIEEQHVRFEVNRRAACLAGLSFRSDLLARASRVVELDDCRIGGSPENGP